VAPICTTKYTIGTVIGDNASEAISPAINVIARPWKKKACRRACAGMMQNRENGIATIITRGGERLKLADHKRIDKNQNGGEGRPKSRNTC
jgi:hypothetical protein